MFSFTLRPGLELRLLELQHVPPLYALCDKNRAHLRRFLPWIEKTHGEADVRAFVEGALRQLSDGLGFHAGIFVEGELAGCIGMHPISRDNSSVSLGYWLDEDFEGRGIITDAVRAVTRHCLETLRLHRVEIRCSTANERSCAIPRRLGFHFEGTLRHAQKLPDGFTDINVFSKLSSDEN